MSWTPEQVIQRVAECASAMSFQCGEPGVNIAGHTISFLAAHPEHVERFMREGNELWVDGTITFEGGCLSFECIDGKQRTSAEVRDARGINN